MVLSQERFLGQVLPIALLGLCLAACGGGVSGPLGPSSGTFDANGSTGGTRGGSFPDEQALQGGVLATFMCQGEVFHAWVSNATLGQQLVDAHSGTGMPITSICATIVAGPGAGRHNEPWRWSVSNALPPSFAGYCVGCGNTLSRPSLIEANVLAGTPNCKPVHGGPLVSLPGPPNPLPPPNPSPTRYVAFMQVVLTQVQDFR